MLAAHAKERCEVVPGPQDEGITAQLHLWDDEPAQNRAPTLEPDVGLCPSCGGKMKIVELVDAGKAPSSRSPPRQPASTPQLSLLFGPKPTCYGGPQPFFHGVCLPNPPSEPQIPPTESLGLVGMQLVPTSYGQQLISFLDP
ncbi:MAG: hypothetical protein IPJ88_03550 [Myxococcales bacterium]|nr:MAG: hypothetical protein IPJ88_03550 [Myxococcales bacterium]